MRVLTYIVGCVCCALAGLTLDEDPNRGWVLFLSGMALVVSSVWGRWR